ncbi:MAG: amino acid permease [Methanomassiliicoccales archaeon]|nr:amino acid permease [Methanomassiliicoccales archaeon]
MAPVTLFGMGAIIGVGIYVIIGGAAGRAGNALWLSFLLSAVAAAFTGLTYARFAQLRPKNAPEYQYVDMAFGPLPGFLAEYLMLSAMIISAAAVALGFAAYLENLLGVPILVGALLIVIAAGVISYVGISESAAVAGILTLIQVLGLIVIIGLGSTYLGHVDLMEMPAGLAGVLGGASLIFFAYLGFEGIANYAEEMKNPVRDLPRAILLAIALSTILYVLTAVAAVSVVGSNALSESPAPLALVAEEALGENAGIALSYIAIVATANTTIVFQLNSSRALWQLGDMAILPRFLGRVSKRRRTPSVAALAVTLIAGAFALSGNVEQIAGYTNFAMLLSFIGVNAAALKVFRTKELPGGKGKALLLNTVVPVMGILTAAMLAISAGVEAAVLGTVLFLSGALIYWLMASYSRRKKSSG